MSFKVIAIHGGIGTGKSVVAKILGSQGFSVYDCDERAKAIMDGSDAIKKEIKEKIDSQSIVEGNIDRKRLASVVFSDNEKLEQLNRIVHGAIREDIKTWAHSKETANKPVFVETAILYQSGLDKMVDEAWEVVAPLPLRIERICKRNNLTAEDAVKRIESQRFEPETMHPYPVVIANDERESVLEQVNRELQRICACTSGYHA